MATRIEKDSLGEMQVPADALYGAQTQRAVENFPISGIPFSRAFIKALGQIKHAAASVNEDLGLLDAGLATPIREASQEVIDGNLDTHFVLDVYQTGSGTSTNMNTNEVISNRAIQIVGGTVGSKDPVHPNDHVNMSQSSNDVIPTAIHVAAYNEVVEHLLPGLEHLAKSLRKRSAELDGVVKTGRTHLMDAMPITLGQQLGGHATQVEYGIERVKSALPRLAELAIGGTATGSGINAHPEFGGRMAKQIARITGNGFTEAPDHFEAQAAQDGSVELSGQLKTVAASLMKIANDFRWMNSGPQTGLMEIVLPATQPGSSIMPGKINPVMAEAMTLVAAQVIANDVAITIGGQSGNFELNLMLPLIAHNLLGSILLLGNVCRVFADKAVDGFTVNTEHMADLVDKNPILATALNTKIGYDTAAKIAKTAMAENRKVRDVAREMTDLSEEELDTLLDTKAMTLGGIPGESA
jgi:fumarate hydratase, class II